MTWEALCLCSKPRPEPLEDGDPVGTAETGQASMDGPGPGELLGNTGAKPALVHTGGCPPAPRGLLRTLPQGLWTMLTNIFRLIFIHSKIPNVHAFFSITPFL